MHNIYIICYIIYNITGLVRIITGLSRYVIEKLFSSQIFYNVSGESGYDSKPVIYTYIIYIIYTIFIEFI